MTLITLGKVKEPVSLDGCESLAKEFTEVEMTTYFPLLRRNQRRVERNPTIPFALPMIPCAWTYIINFSWRHHTVVNAEMITPRSVNSKRFVENHLIYLHCVSVHDFLAVPNNLCCIQLSCREIHFSFIEERQFGESLWFPRAKRSSCKKCEVLDLFDWNLVVILRLVAFLC